MMGKKKPFLPSVSGIFKKSKESQNIDESEIQEAPLTSKDLVHAGAMLQYCKKFHFDNKQPDDLCRKLFSIAEDHVAPDVEVVMAFMAEYPQGEPCACAFAIHKLIIASQKETIEIPTKQIGMIFPSGKGPVKTLSILCGGQIYSLVVEHAQVDTLLDFLRRSKSACMEDIIAEDKQNSFCISIDIPTCISIDSQKTTASSIDTYRLSDNDILRLEDYYVVDVETTGLNKKSDKIVELAWVKVEHEEIVNKFSTMVDPERHISPSASAVNGIYDSDVQGAPKYAELRELVSTTLVGSTIIGHNVYFDLSFISRLIGEANGRILYVDTLSLARKAFPGLSRYTLSDLCNTLNLPHSTHRALDDVLATQQLFVLCQENLRQRAEAALRERREKREREKTRLKELYGESPLYNISFVYTGTFTLPREEMEALALSVGAVTRTKVTSRTDYLVVGDVAELPEWAIARKIGRADELIASGGKVRKICEADYLKLIADAKAVII